MGLFGLHGYPQGVIYHLHRLLLCFIFFLFFLFFYYLHLTLLKGFLMVSPATSLLSFRTCLILNSHFCRFLPILDFTPLILRYDTLHLFFSFFNKSFHSHYFLYCFVFSSSNFLICREFSYQCPFLSNGFSIQETWNRPLTF